MNPPFIPRALVAAAAPPAEYDVIDGDLHEEYVMRVNAVGAAAANRWYWSQAMRSIPALLSYSRNRRSAANTLITGAIVLVVLLAMLLVKDGVDTGIDSIHHPHGMPAVIYFAADWGVAALFGLLLAAIAGSGARLAIGASLFLLVAFALPILVGVSPRLPADAWILLLGAIPAMALGAAVLQVIRRTLHR